MEPQNSNPELITDPDLETGLDFNNWFPGQGNPTIEHGRLSGGSILALLQLTPGVIYQLALGNANGGKAAVSLTLDNQQSIAAGFYFNKVGLNTYQFICPLSNGQGVLEVTPNNAVINRLSIKPL